MSRKSLYNKKAIVKRLKLSGQDAVGGISQVITTEFQIACRLRQLNAAEQGVGGKDGTISTHRVYCANADIRNKDEIIVSDIIYDVNTINPISADKGSMEMDVTLRY